MAIQVVEKKVMRFSQGDDRIKNIIITVEDNPYCTVEEVKHFLGKGGKVFHNDANDVDIRVSIKGIKHRAPRHNADTYRAVTKIETIIRDAKSIGELPVDEDEKGRTRHVFVYYSPVNILGQQYSARMIVKEYERFGRIIDELGLYNIALKKEKTSSPYGSTSKEGDVFYEDVKSEFKVKELIHKTKREDFFLLGIDVYE